MRDLCAELDILFVADEVITGFGRTGPIFACEHEGIVPDLMTMAKGLTSGYLPMGAVMMRESIYSVIADASARSGMAVGHGFTYSGHPVSAAAGLAAIALYTEGGLMEQGRQSGEALIAGLKALEDHPLVGEARGRGMLAALEIVSNKNTKAKFDPSVKVGEKLFETAYANGLIIRAFADGTLGFAPPLCCTQDDIALLLERTRKTLDDLLAVSEIRKAAA
jgi:adenosylmethionine-8-amino-7-oxononanoate aminotransferase